MRFFSPLEQFEVLILRPIYLGYDFSITVASFSLFIAAGLFLLFFFLGFRNAGLIPTLLQALCEAFYNFIITIIVQQAGPRGLRYFPIFFVVFFLIMFSSLVGLVPFAFTPTSHIVFTYYSFYL